MTQSNDSPNTTRRRFLQQSGSLAAGAAMLGSLARTVHAGEDNTIRLALIGCGARGSGAVGDALSVPDSGPIKLYAMADLVKSRMSQSLGALK
jgi:hypothetical protein